MNAEPNAAYDEFRHEALLYRGLADFVDRTVPFIRGGLEAGESVAVVTSAKHIDALRRELGSDAGVVAFADIAVIGANPARIIPFWQDFIAIQDGRPLRGIGEPIWAGRSAAELVECQRHESLLNVAIDTETPIWLLCPYDVTCLDPEIIDDPLADRRQPSSTAAGGRGLWLANQLCDLVQIRSHPSGTQIRLHVRG